MNKRAEEAALEAYPNESFVSEEYADKTFQESASWGVLESTVYFKESR